MSAAVVVSLGLFLFAPALLKIKKERSDTLRIFLSIPKAAVNTIFISLNNNNEVKEIEDEAIEETRVEHTINVRGNTTNSVPILKQLLERYVFVLCIDFSCFSNTM